jgi:hypothetical protein
MAGPWISWLDMQQEKQINGCKQWVYCNECLAFPMGLGCPKRKAEGDESE